MEEPVAGRRSQGAGRTEYGVRNTKPTILNTLAVILLLATGAVVIFYLLIALMPTSALNPFPPHLTPPPTPSPLLIAGQERGGGGPKGRGRGEVPTPTPFPTPTALRPATLTPTPEPSFPFTATVETGPVSKTSDCRAMLVGVVLDREGHGLEAYPVHLWTTEYGIRNTDQVLFSDRSGRWQAVLPAGARGLWYVQLHAPDARQFYPPLSAIIAVALPDACPQATVLFREQ